MEYIYAALILHHAGKKVDEASVKTVLSAAGVAVDESRVKALIAALEGVNIADAIAKAAVAPVAAAPAAAAACPSRGSGAGGEEGGQEAGGRVRDGRARGPLRVDHPPLLSSSLSYREIFSHRTEDPIEGAIVIRGMPKRRGRSPRERSDSWNLIPLLNSVMQNQNLARLISYHPSTSFSVFFIDPQ